MDIQKLSNSIARKEVRTNKVHEILFKQQNDISMDYTSSGYRKYTTGEYVCHAYRNKFGWKNTYYQNAICIISYPLWVGWLIGEDL